MDHHRIAEAGGQFIAISTDQIFALKIFQRSVGGLPYVVGSDWMRRVSELYGVLDAERGTAQRSVFVLDGAHRLRYRNTQFEAGNREHYEAVFRVLAAQSGA